MGISSTGGTTLARIAMKKAESAKPAKPRTMPAPKAARAISAKSAGVVCASDKAHVICPP